MKEKITLADYPNRKRGSEPNYILIEKAMHHLAIEGRPGEAIRAIEAAIDGFVAMGDDRGEARARSKAAIIFRRVGQMERAIREAEAALRFFRANPEPAFSSSAALELGQAYEVRGDFDAALRTYLSALEELGEGRRGEPKELRRMRAYIQDCAANAYSQTGHFDQARPLREKAIAVMEEQKLSHDCVAAWTNLALDHIHLKDMKGAARSLQSAREWLQKLNLQTAEGRSQQAKIETVFGLILCNLFETVPRGDASVHELLARTRVALRRALNLYDGLGAPLRAANSALTLADVEIEHGSVEQAAELLRMADRRIPPDTEGRNPMAHRLRERLDSLRSRQFMAGVQGTPLAKIFSGELFRDRPGVRVSMSDSPFVPAQSEQTPASPFSDPRDLFPILWANHHDEIVDKIEDMKSIDSLSQLARRPKPRR